MKKNELSWAEIKESIAELRESQKETNLQIKNLTEKVSGIAELRESQNVPSIAELRKLQKENSQLIKNLTEKVSGDDTELRESQKDTDRRIKALTEKVSGDDAELRESQKDTDRRIKALTENISGISDSNGQFAEEYFYNSLEKKMEFAGVHFDSISNEFRRLRKTPNGRIKDQFDIVLFNGNTIALIEIKYKARKKNLDKMLKQKISNFRLLFPEYAKHKIYLGIGGMSFDKNVVDEAKKLGIGLLKQVGETIEYETKWVRAY